MAIWQMREAKARLGELLESAEKDGPQTITKKGKAQAVVLSAKAYQKMLGHSDAWTEAENAKFIDFLLNGPKFDELEIERDTDTGREIDLG